MVFAFTVTRRANSGSVAMVFGTFTNGAGDSGGDIETGLSKVEGIVLQHTGSAVVANAPVVNESFPLQGGDVTIVTDLDADGIFMAWGQSG